MQAACVTSEIGRLKKVILHRPGKELLYLTPDTLDELLFDDIPFLKTAQAEHDAFAHILSDNGVQIIYLEDLAAEAIGQDMGIREAFLHQYIAEAGIVSADYTAAVFDYLNGIRDSKALILKTMAGVPIHELAVQPKKSLSQYVLGEHGMLINPMPNLYFTRDPFSFIGHGVSLNRMHSLTRNRETIYGEYIFKYHPDFKNKTELYYSRSGIASIEGGDILNINHSTIALGLSQRTTANAADALARKLFYDSQSSVHTILVFKIPAIRAFMHLDTVLTQIDYAAFTIHPGVLDRLQVFKITRGTVFPDLNVTALDEKLETILETYTGSGPVELIPCAGGDKIAADREQWNDGANTLCIGPGKVVVYDRNTVTNELFYKKGIKVFEMPSSELSRGRGGPRCMSMPLQREALT
ncbi:MAG: arginine deiminase [Treponema sp.]